MEAEQLFFEEATSLAGHGAPVLITILRGEPRGTRYLRESHVFLPDSELHLHEIGQGVAPAASSEFVARSLRETHRLLVSFLAAERGNTRWPSDDPAYRSQAMAEHPFFRFRLAGRFRDSLWEIQDWTTSQVLRGLLAQVTSYRADLVEAELLARVFSERVSEPEASGA